VASKVSGRELTRQVMEAQAMMGRTEPPVQCMVTMASRLSFLWYLNVMEILLGR
jgi:hypothetical protein